MYFILTNRYGIIKSMPRGEQMDYEELTKFTWTLIAVVVIGIIIQAIFGWTLMSVVSGILFVPGVFLFIYWVIETIKKI